MTLARYHIRRGRKVAELPSKLRHGVRIDTRKHTSHCLRPTGELVARTRDAGSDRAWEQFARDYLQLLSTRFEADRTPFDRLAQLARTRHVFIGCSCPSARNPDVRRCHTVLALRFLRDRYPDLAVEFP